MKLMVIVLNKTEVLQPLMAEFAKMGINGSTILQSTGMVGALSEYDDFSFLSSLKIILDSDHTDNKTIFMVIEDEQVEPASDCVERIVGDLTKPNTAILFTVPVDNIRGLHK